MQCVILAGGLGTRMQPQTEKVPKSLLPVGEHPFLKYQLDWLVSQGISNVVMCIGHKGEMIRAYAQEGASWGIPIRYVDEHDQLQGTAGALRQALKAGCLESQFCVLYGDSYLLMNIRQAWDVFQNTQEPALMTVLRNNNQWDRSNVCFQNRKVVLYDKKAQGERAKDMRYIDYGLIFLRRMVVERDIPPLVRCELSDVLHQLSLRGELAGFEVKERFYEIGSPDGLADFKKYITSNALHSELRRPA
jgi:NDP-sugar pyrophosphorylase family protein